MSGIDLVQTLQDRLPDAVQASHSYRGDVTVLIARDRLLPVARLLRDDPAFQMNLLVDLTAVDFSVFAEQRSPAFFVSSGVRVAPSTEIPDQDPWTGPLGGTRFVVVYHFFSLSLKHRLRVEVPVDEADPEVDSVVEVWAGANWLEREVWDMFGIRFRGHPNLKRILMYAEFVGHPLRKDYPVNKRQPLIGPLN
jgi:NADH-quinone oxidoreductase subunit C